MLPTVLFLVVPTLLLLYLAYDTGDWLVLAFMPVIWVLVRSVGAWPWRWKDR